MLQYQTRSGVLLNSCNCGLLEKLGLLDDFTLGAFPVLPKTHVANFQRCRCKALGKYPPHCAATSRQSRPAPLPGFDIVFLELARKSFSLIATGWFGPVVCDGGFDVRRPAGEPGEFGQVHCPQPNSTFILNQGYH